MQCTLGGRVSPNSGVALVSTHNLSPSEIVACVSTNNGADPGSLRSLVPVI